MVEKEYSVKESAYRLHVSARSILTWIKTGKLRPVKRIGGRWYVLGSAIEKMERYYLEIR